MRYFLILLFIICGNYCHAQSFPESWEGKWEGTVDIWNHDSIAGSFRMSLEIKPTDTAWTYIIDYQRDPAKPDVRKYSLIPINDLIGHYAIDEHNGIVLDSYKVGNCLLSSFSGLGSVLYTRTCRVGNTLEYEITSVFEAPERISGDLVFKKDTIPEIKSYQVYNTMKARLNRTN